MISILRTILVRFSPLFQKRVTVQYPEENRNLAPRYRGRIILSRDPDGGERCVACNLCAVACPVDCIALQAAEDENGRRYPILPYQLFALHLLRLLRGSCPTYAIQLTPDFEMGEFHRQNLVYEKHDLLIDAREYPDITSGALPESGSVERTRARRHMKSSPVDVHSLLP